MEVLRTFPANQQGSMKPAKHQSKSLKQIKAGLERKAEVVTKEKRAQKQAEKNLKQEKKRKKWTPKKS